MYDLTVIHAYRLSLRNVIKQTLHNELRRIWPTNNYKTIKLTNTGYLS